MTHPSTELSRSHNKNRAAGHNFNQTVLLPYEEQPGSITEKLLKTNNWPRCHTDFKPTPCASGYMRLSTSAEQLQLDVRLNGTRSSGSVISHPTCCHRAPRRPRLCHILLLQPSPTWSCCLPSPLLQIGAHWGVRDIGKCPKRHGKITTELLKWCFSAQPVEKCVGSSQNLKSHWAATNNKSALMQEDQIIVFPPLNQTTFLAS